MSSMKKAKPKVVSKVNLKSSIMSSKHGGSVEDDQVSPQVQGD